MQHRVSTKKTKCPHCKSIHSYVEIIFPLINENGVWEIECQNCSKNFHVQVRNPKESSFQPNYLIKRRHDESASTTGFDFSEGTIEYNFDLNKQALLFPYEKPPLYLCAITNSNLEIKALDKLNSCLAEVRDQYASTVNFCLANRCPDYKYTVVRIALPCECGAQHIATFYCDFLMNGAIQDKAEDYLLADISETEISETLDGLFSKTDIMAYLEKLIIRWNLLFEQIIIATPFVGHQYLPKESKLATWNWLLAMLNPKKSVFITRQHTLTGYISVLNDVEGLNHDFLKEYELESKVISANTKKNDFHAKFYSGISSETTEVLSGSANLVSGPSLENISFKHQSRELFDSKYLQKLNVNIPLIDMKLQHWVEIKMEEGMWHVTPQSGAISITSHKARRFRHAPKSRP